MEPSQHGMPATLSPAVRSGVSSIDLSCIGKGIALPDYFGLAAALIAAAHEEVDSTPMEGFDPAALDDILGLRARALRSVAILPVGYRVTDEDWLVNFAKVRRPRDQFVTEV